MPTKTRDVVLLDRYTRTYSNGYNGVSPSGNVYQDTRTGISNPKWKSIIKSGGNATTAMSGTRFRRLESKPFSISAGQDLFPPKGNVHYQEHCEGTTGAFNTMPSVVSGTSLTSADNQALSRAYDRVKEQRNQFQGIVALGELRETVQFLRSPFKGAVKHVQTYLQEVKRAKRLDPRWLKTGYAGANRKSGKAVADAWLETSFALKPLINDVKEGAEALARINNEAPRRAVVTATGRDQRGRDGRTPFALGNCTTGMLTYRDVTTQEVRYKCAMDYTRRADRDSVDKIQRILGFNLEDFVPSIYELIPFSFLVDYFSNLGKIIEAGCSSQSDIAWTLRTERLETVRHGQVKVWCPQLTSDPGNGWWESGAEDGSFVLSRTSVSRSGGAALGIPTFEVSLPGRGTQWANMLALFASSDRSLRGRG